VYDPFDAKSGLKSKVFPQAVVNVQLFMSQLASCPKAVADNNAIVATTATMTETERI